MLSVHEGNKVFECEHIPSIHEGIESFKIIRWRNMLSVHEGNKAFERETCYKCDKSFSLKNHMLA